MCLRLPYVSTVNSPVCPADTPLLTRTLYTLLRCDSECSPPYPGRDTRGRSDGAAHRQPDDSFREHVHVSGCQSGLESTGLNPEHRPRGVHQRDQDNGITLIVSLQGPSATFDRVSGYYHRRRHQAVQAGTHSVSAPGG